MWKYGLKQWADNGEIKKFSKSLCGPHKPFKTNRPTTYETGISPTAALSHWGQASSRKQSECGRHGLSNILKLEIAQSEQDVSPFCKESDMTYSWKRQIGLFLRQ